VINVSYGFSVFTQDLAEAVSVAHSYDGAVIVASMGNSNLPTVFYPAALPESIAVGATGPDNTRWDGTDNRCQIGAGSTYGDHLDVVAPGVWINVATRSGNDAYGNSCGTSLAAPLVSGLVGIMETVNPSLGVDEAKLLIQAGAIDGDGDPLEDAVGFDEYYGWGRVNMEQTLQATRASISMRVDGKAATRLHFAETTPVAATYDFIRLDSLDVVRTWQGTGRCLEDNSINAETEGSHLDTDTPQPGEVFVYLAAINTAPGPGSYGGVYRVIYDDDLYSNVERPVPIACPR
jgi:hypothetical protein